jgi:hypothetical protein
MSQKHVRLALFSWSRPKGDSLKSAMSAWNTQYPMWSYKQESNFGRDVLMAKRRALKTPDASPTSQDKLDAWLYGKEPITKNEEGETR